MADENPIATTQEQLPAIPDNIFEEIEKVAKMEKDIRFLQFRQGAVENSVTTLREVVEAKTATSEDPTQVISEETKDEPVKEDKNKVKEDKLKSSLDSSEKKRYENIGVEFAKGASKIFNELEKAQRLKERMQTSKFKKEEEKQEEVKKEEKKKKKFSLKTLALAITAVAGIMYALRDHIDEFIPGFKNGAESTFGWIKSKISSIFGDIVDSITSIFNGIFGDIFKGPDGVKTTMNTFFLDILPDVMYQSGLALFRALGGSVSTANQTLLRDEQSTVNRAAKDGREQAERERVAAEADRNSVILTDTYATAGQLESARRHSGRDAIVQGNLLSSVADIYGVQEEVIRDMSSYGNDFMMFLDKNREIIRNQYNDSDSEKLARLFYVQRFNKPATDAQGNTQEFQQWYNNVWTQQINANNWDRMLEAADNFRKRVQTTSTLEEDRKRIEEIQRQAVSTVRQNGLRFSDDDSGRLELNIAPAEVAQDLFGAEVTSLFDNLKNLFSGNVEINTLADTAIKFINEVIGQLMQPLLTQFENFQNVISDIVVNQNQVNVHNAAAAENRNSPWASNSYRGSLDDVTNQNPIILLDLELNSGLLEKFTDIFKSEGELINSMNETNTQLKAIRDMTIVKSSSGDGSVSNQQMSIVSGLQQRMGVCEEAIKVQDGRVSHIETYLESQDNDGNDDSDVKDFALQAQS